MEQPRKPPLNHRYWTRKEQTKHEDKVTDELEKIKGSVEDLRKDVNRLSQRVAYYVGAFSILVIVIEKLWK